MAKLKKLTKEMVLEELEEIFTPKDKVERPDPLRAIISRAQARNRQVLERQTRRPR